MSIRSSELDVHRSQFSECKYFAEGSSACDHTLSVDVLHDILWCSPDPVRKTLRKTRLCPRFYTDPSSCIRTLGVSDDHITRLGPEFHLLSLDRPVVKVTGLTGLNYCSIDSYSLLLLTEEIIHRVIIRL